jgi:Dcp1-like decapping family
MTDDINLRVIKRQDPEVDSIVDTSSHVTVYSFDETDQSWVSY